MNIYRAVVQSMKLLFLIFMQSTISRIKRIDIDKNMIESDENPSLLRNTNAPDF